jgi:hypothetical protein
MCIEPVANVQNQLNELAEIVMASVSRIILIGNLGRVSRSALAPTGQQTLSSDIQN